MAEVRAADEVAIRALCFECVGQGQAAHDVAAAHLQGGIGTEGDLQWNAHASCLVCAPKFRATDAPIRIIGFSTYLNVTQLTPKVTMAANV